MMKERIKKSGIDFKLGCQASLSDQVGEHTLGHCGTADIAVADEKYFYHCFVSPCFALECPVLQGVLGLW